MKKSVKKKTDKFIQFKNRTNSVNYRDKKAIIAQFNKSVREYKRFSEVFSGGDEDWQLLSCIMQEQTFICVVNGH